MNLKLFTPQIRSVIKDSETACIGMHRHCLDIDIFFDCFLDDLSLSCVKIIEKYKIKEALYKASDSVIQRKKRNKNCSKKFDKSLVRLFKNCWESSQEMFGFDYIPPEIVFLNFLDVDIAPKAIRDVVLIDKDLVQDIVSEITFSLSDVDISLIESIESIESQTPFSRDKEIIDMFEENEVLSQFAENLNIKAVNNKFDKIVDFDDKISEISTVLCRKKKPNVILVGTAGTGKTSLVEGLVNKIVNGEAPELLSNKVIYSVSLSSMVAGTTYRGQFEQRLEEFVNEAKKYDNVILFIDEVHTLVGAGGSGGSKESLEASNILKPELARGTISCIGATTINEYNATIKKDSALDRRFERVTVREPSKFQMRKILPTITSYYEEFHHVSYSKEFIDSVIDYCERFSPNKHYPDKAVDVVDHCGAQAKVSHFELNPEMKKMQLEIIRLAKEQKNHDGLLAEFEKKLSGWSERKQSKRAEVKVSHLESFFSRKESPLSGDVFLNEVFSDIVKKFAGHNKTINDLKESIIISNYNLNTKVSSPSVFCINGDDKTGKTYLMSILRENFERSGANTLSYSGIHFSDAYASQKVISGVSSGSSLCEKILIYPNSIILIDDFDSIHPSVVNLFSEIFKEGKLELPNGDCADFSNCKFFLTSRKASNNKLGFNSSKETSESVIPTELCSSFNSNLFLHKLDEKALRRVLWHKLTKIKKSLNIKNVELDFDFNFLKSFVKENSSKRHEIQDLSKSFDFKINKYVQARLIKGEKKINLKKLQKTG